MALLQITYRQIATLFLPLTLSLFIPQINYLTNAFFVSKTGELNLATYTLSGVYYLIFAVMGIGLNSGIQMLMSKRLGAKDEEGFINLFHHGNSVNVLVSLIGLLVSYTILEPILQACISHSAIIPLSVSFIQIRILGLPFLYLYLARNSVFINLDKTHLLIYTSVLETLTNILLDYALIFGHWGMPCLGLNGAAIASVLSEIIGYLASWLIIKYHLSKSFPISYQLKWNKSFIKTILVTSLPLVCQFLFAVVSWEIFFMMIEHLGSRLLAISGVMRTLIGIMSILPWALGSTTNTLISNLIGQKTEKKLIWKGMRKLIGVSLSVSLFVGLLVFTNLRWILSQFSPDAEFLALAYPVSQVILIAIVLMSIGNILLNTLLGIGYTKINLVIELISVCTYLVYTYIAIIYTRSSLSVAWSGEIVYWLCMASCCLFFLTHWKKNASYTP